MSEIRYFDPDELPYGVLSNYYLHPIKVDKKQYPSNIHFIYANFFKSPIHKQIILNTENPLDLRKVFDEIVQQNIRSKKEECLLKATHARFNQDKDFKNALMETGNKKINYANKQYKTYTRILTTLRSKYLEERSVEDEKELVYKIYLVGKIFDKYLREGITNLENFSAPLDYDEIIEDYGDYKIKRDVEPIDVVYRNYRDGFYPHIRKEMGENGYLIRFSQCNNISTYNELVLHRLKNAIMRDYVEKVAKSMNVQHPYKEISKISVKKFNELKESVFNAFFEGNYKPTPYFEESIREELETIFSPEQVDKCMRELSELERPRRGVRFGGEMIKEFEKENPLKFSVKDVHLINDDDILSPSNKNMMIEIDGRFYPSIEHYIISCFYLTLPGITTMNDAHDRLMINEKADPKNMNNYHTDPLLKYAQDFDTIYYEQTKELNKIANNAKFKDAKLASILKATMGHPLVYENTDDDVLGIHERTDRKENNLQGKYLMELRERLNVEPADINKMMEEYRKSMLDVEEVLQQNPNIARLITRKLNRLSGIYKDVREYLQNKLGETNINDAKLLEFVLYDLLRSCKKMVNKKVMITKIPLSYQRTLEGLFGNNKVLHKMIWKYVTVLTSILLDENIDYKKFEDEIEFNANFIYKNRNKDAKEIIKQITEKSDDKKIIRVDRNVRRPFNNLLYDIGYNAFENVFKSLKELVEDLGNTMYGVSDADINLASQLFGIQDIVEMPEDKIQSLKEKLPEKDIYLLGQKDKNIGNMRFTNMMNILYSVKPVEIERILHFANQDMIPVYVIHKEGEEEEEKPVEFSEREFMEEEKEEEEPELMEEDEGEVEEGDDE